MRGLRPLIVSAIASVLLAGCKTSVETEIPVTRILSAVQGQSWQLGADIRVEMTDRATCERHAVRLSEAIAEEMPSIIPRGCEDAGGAVWAVFQGKIPLLAEPGLDESPDTALGVLAAPFRGGVVLAYLRNAERIGAIWSALPEDVAGPLPYTPDFILSARLINDLDRPVRFDLRNVYVDDAPTTVAAPTLAPGESALVRLSNVSNDAFGKTRKPVEIGYLLPRD